MPTFAQSFDFVEEKFGIHIEINKSVTNIENYAYRIIGSDGFTIANEYDFKTKREANISACKAIKEYINDLQKNRV